MTCIGTNTHSTCISEGNLADFPTAYVFFTCLLLIYGHLPDFRHCLSKIRKMLGREKLFFIKFSAEVLYVEYMHALSVHIPSPEVRTYVKEWVHVILDKVPKPA